MSDPTSTRLAGWKYGVEEEELVVVPRNRERKYAHLQLIVFKYDTPCAHSPTMTLPAGMLVNHAFADKHVSTLTEELGDGATHTWKERGVLFVDAVLEPANTEIRPEILRKIKRYGNETHLGNKMAMTLRIIMGRRYMVTANISVPTGLANGMLVQVLDVRLKEGVVPTWDAEQQAHRVRATDVELIAARFLNDEWRDFVIHPELGPGICVLDACPPTRQHQPVLKMKLNTEIFSFKATQFSLLQAHAITGHKVQGRTTNRIRVEHIFAQSGNLHRPAAKRGWLYVVLSRVGLMEGIALHVEKLPMSQLTNPHIDLEELTKTLERWHAQTMARFNPAGFYGQPPEKTGAHI